MDKFIASIDELESVVSTIGVASTPDSITVLSNGVSKTETKLISSIKVLTKTSTLVTRFRTSVPDGYEGQSVTIATKSAVFNGTLEALAALKADIYNALDDDGQFYLGVEGKAQVAVPVLSDEPEEVKMGVPLVQFILTAEANNKLIRKGLASTNAKGKDGVQNGILTINTLTGDINAFSTDSFQFAWADVKAQLPEMPDDERAQKVKAKMEAEMAAYSEATGGKQTAEALVVNIPHDEIVRLRQLTAGAKKITYFVDRTHVSVQIDNNIIYTFTQGLTSRVIPSALLPNIKKMEEQAELVELDNVALADAIELHNKIMSLKGKSAKAAVELSVSEDGIEAVSEGVSNNIKVAKLTGDSNFRVDGSYLKTALSLMDKGNLVIEVAEKIVFLKNGTIEAADSSAVIGIMQATAPAEEKEEGEETETDEGKDENPSE